MTYILGINMMHGDSSACILKDGILIAAVEEERFRRIKHWAGFPILSIEYCLKEAKIKINDVTHVAVNRDPKANLFKKIKFSLKNRINLKMIFERVKNAKKWMQVGDFLKINFPQEVITARIHYIEHHMAHLSSAFHVSPFDRSVVASIDGFGDFSSAAWGIGSGANIDIADKVYFPHSLGIFYQALTQFLGFPNYGDEYKVMGLAPYGEPKYLKEMREIVTLKSDGSFFLNLKYFRHHKEKVDYEWDNCSPRVGTLFADVLEQLLGPKRIEGEELTQRHKDIARSIQVMYEEALFNLLNVLYDKYKCDNLALAGGCAMNSVANGKIARNTRFKNIYVQSAAGDAGGAIGAAFTVWHRLGNKDRIFVMDHSYWGPSYLSESNKLVEEVGPKLLEDGFYFLSNQTDDEISKKTAKMLANGKVVGWFQGRSEWGPRALGNRSILCDPRRHDAKDLLNLKIKRRESFRPFAPSILRERVSDWFEEDSDVPFMMQVFQIKYEKRSLIPAVTHFDGSGRLQTVSEESNFRYHSLLNEFEKITGVPILLNTSFNENEPIVCHPSEALDCFLRTKMDLIVLNNHMISREKLIN